MVPDFLSARVVKAYGSGREVWLVIVTDSEGGELVVSDRDTEQEAIRDAREWAPLMSVDGATVH